MSGRTSGRAWVAVVAPHPDDECLTGLLALRLQRECGLGVKVVTATLGSKAERQKARAEELAAACGALGWSVDLQAARAEGEAAKVEGIARGIAGAALVMVPHAADGHATHRATHRWAVAAMDASGGRWRVAETEYWHPMARPNLMVGAHGREVEELRRALELHRGEVARNDYASRLGAWMSDNVRRGAELVGGEGAAAPELEFATLYRDRWCEDGRWTGGDGKWVVDSSEELGAWWGRG